MSLTQLLANFEREPGAARAEVDAFAKDFGFEPPPGYLDFLRESNGGEGFIGERYFMATRLEELRSVNEQYQVARFAPGLLLFGSSGGGEGYAFDFRSGRPLIVAVPLVTLSLNELIPMGASFDEFLEKLAKDAE